MTKTQRIAIALSSAVIVGSTMLGSISLRAGDDPVKLTGCLIKGEGDNGGYLLVNVPSEPGAAGTSARSVEPGALGTSGSFANIFYWLGDDGSLKEHVGHQVEIEGDKKGDVKDGEMKIDRKEQWTEIELKSDGRGMKAQVPNASVVASTDADRKINVLVRRVDVGKVRMVAATCR